MQSEPGKGTTVLLTLWLAIAQPETLARAAGEGAADPVVPAALRRPAPGIAQAEQEGTLALLVDDHPVNRMLLLRQVNTLGYAAETANDGLHALELWKSRRFAIVITDCNMPNMDGYELARSIRRLESGDYRRRVPIVACTANAMRGEAEKCFAAGMDDYLTKPIELKQLLAKLDQWLPVPEAGETAAFAPGTQPSGGPVGAAQGGLVDLALIADTFGSDAASVSGILSALRTANEQDAELLRQAVRAEDLKQVTYAAHRMAGAGEMIGARAFSDVCKALEKGSRAGDWQAIRDAMAAFNAQWLRLRTYLDAA
jgi:CheY-like chemotaxis protein/HPt (histidine-containing phosphotransfer) domain-containing protein